MAYDNSGYVVGLRETTRNRQILGPAVGSPVQFLFHRLCNTAVVKSPFIGIGSRRHASAKEFQSIFSCGSFSDTHDYELLVKVSSNFYQPLTVFQHPTMIPQSL
jgi:hypothetical protein